MRSLALFLSFFIKTYYRLKSSGRISFGKKVIIGWNTRIKGPGKVVIGDECNLWSFDEPFRIFTYAPEAEITIGNKTRINGALLQARKKIEIGAECLIGSAIIMDNDFHHPDPKKRSSKEDIPTAPIFIRNKVWLCGQCAILKGVTIGEGSVVGFRAVVTKDVEAFSVVAGNPAVVVRRLK